MINLHSVSRIIIKKIRKTPSMTHC